MVYQRVAHYLWLKGDTYYFNRRVPKDMQGHYKASRIIICLKTSRKDTAVRSAKSIAQRLEDYWLSLRLSKIDVPALHFLRDKPVDGYSSAEAAALRDAMLEKGLSIASVKRNFSTIRSIINLTISPPTLHSKEQNACATML